MSACSVRSDSCNIAIECTLVLSRTLLSRSLLNRKKNKVVWLSPSLLWLVASVKLVLIVKDMHAPILLLLHSDTKHLCYVVTLDFQHLTLDFQSQMISF